MDSYELRVPVALTAAGETVRPEEANRESDYFCPDCGEPLIYRETARTRAHFAHHGDSICAPETILHHAAMHILKRTIQSWLDGECASPEFIRSCGFCDKHEIKQRLPGSIVGVDLERTAPSGYRLDVALFGDMQKHEIAAGLEVVVTHSVDDLKARDLEVPWLELRAEDIIENPRRVPVKRDSLPPDLCQDCRTLMPRLQQTGKEVLARWNMPWPAKPYVLGIVSCWKCDEEIPVFDWEGGMWAKEPPPRPRPRTVKHRYSKTVGGKYWANTCPGCGIIQGDWHLHGVGGPFGPSYDTDDRRLLVLAQQQGALKPLS